MWCRISSGEFKVREVLTAMNVDFVFNQTHTSLSTYSNKNLRPDFYIQHNDKMAFIEYNGQQHYIPTRWTKRVTQEEAEENRGNRG